MLSAFAPFIVFAVLARALGIKGGLALGALVSAGMLAYGALVRKRGFKALEVGTLVLFAGLAAYAFFGNGQWPILVVRLWVDCGLLLITLATMAIGQPFTLQYAREHTAPEVWNQPSFVRGNYIITGAWVVAFMVMVGADLLMIYRPSVPLWVGITATVSAFMGAVHFTKWYTKRRRAASSQRSPTTP
jgi:hypothetical protein